MSEKTKQNISQTVITSCPYRGLFPYREKDAKYYFGRENEVKRLTELISQNLIVAVLGASGVGKTSLVCAGVIPKLRNENWQCVSFRPKERPFFELCTVLTPFLKSDLSKRELRKEIGKNTASLRKKEISLYEMITQIKKQNSGCDKFLIVIDQLEDLFAICRDDEEQKRFLDLLADTKALFSSGNDIGLRIVFTIRTEFISQILAYNPSEKLLDADVKLAPMTFDQLQKVIEEPLRLCEVGFDSELTKRLIEDIRKENNSLSLLSFVLKQLWDKQQRKHIQLSAYEAIGDISKVLDTFAESVYNALEPDDQSICGRIFIQMILLIDGVSYVRRLVTRTDLVGKNLNVIKQFEDAGIVNVEPEEVLDSEVIEVSNDIVIAKWKRLQDWLSRDLSFHDWLERSQIAFKRWQESNENPEYLLRGPSIAESESWLLRRPEAVDFSEKRFVQSSVANAEQERNNSIKQQNKPARQILTILFFCVAALFFLFYELNNSKSLQRDTETKLNQTIFQSDSIINAKNKVINKIETANNELTGKYKKLQDDYNAMSEEKSSSINKLTEEIEKLNEQIKTAQNEIQQLALDKKQAEKKKLVSLAYQLTAQAKLISIQNPDLVYRSVLLAIESLRRYPTPQAIQLIQYGLNVIVRQRGNKEQNLDIRTIAQMPQEELIKTVCERIPRKLTREEWQTYLFDEPYQKTCP